MNRNELKHKPEEIGSEGVTARAYKKMKHRSGKLKRLDKNRSSLKANSPDFTGSPKANSNEVGEDASDGRGKLKKKKNKEKKRSALEEKVASMNVLAFNPRHHPRDIIDIDHEPAESRKAEKLVAKLFTKIERCGRKIRAGSREHRKELYELFAELYELAVCMAQDDDTLRRFIEWKALLVRGPDMPKNPSPLAWMVYAVRREFHGRSKSMQKRAEKYASVTEFLVHQRIPPKHVLAMLNKYRVSGLLEMARRRRHQESFVGQEVPASGSPGALPSLDASDLAEEYQALHKARLMLTAQEPEEDSKEELEEASLEPGVAQAADSQQCSAATPLQHCSTLGLASRSVGVYLDEEEWNLIQRLEKGDIIEMLLIKSDDGFDCQNIHKHPDDDE